MLILLEKGSLFENASEESMVEKLFCKHFVAQTYCMLFLQEVTVDAVDSLLQSVLRTRMGLWVGSSIRGV